jgi:hypothetical protein
MIFINARLISYIFLVYFDDRAAVISTVITTFQKDSLPQKVIDYVPATSKILIYRKPDKAMKDLFMLLKGEFCWETN